MLLSLAAVQARRSLVEPGGFASTNTLCKIEDFPLGDEFEHRAVPEIAAELRGTV